MLKQTLNQKLLQKLSPQQIQFVQLLQLNTTEIANRVEEELVENAALEQTRTDSEDGEPITEVETPETEDKISEEDALLTEVESFDSDISEYLSNEDDYESYTPDYFSNEERKDIPVLMVSGYSCDTTKKEAYIAGCNEYILKPVFPEKIFFLLEKYLSPAATYSKSY